MKRTSTSVRPSLALFFTGLIACGAACSFALYRHNEQVFYLAAALLKDHFVRAWSSRLAESILNLGRPENIRLVGLALGLDGILNLSEWWCLWKNYSWGKWAVAVSSGLLLPFEIFEIYKGVKTGRVMIFTINLLAVVYLVNSKLREDKAGH